MNLFACTSSRHCVSVSLLVTHSLGLMGWKVLYNLKIAPARLSIFHSTSLNAVGQFQHFRKDSISIRPRSLWESSRAIPDKWVHPPEVFNLQHILSQIIESPQSFIQIDNFQHVNIVGNGERQRYPVVLRRPIVALLENIRYSAGISVVRGNDKLIWIPNSLQLKGVNLTSFNNKADRGNGTDLL